MYLAAFDFAPLAALEPAPGSDFSPLAALEPAPGSDFSPLPLDLIAVALPRSRRNLPNFPVWFDATEMQRIKQA